MALLGQFRRDTLANWQANNPILADGEFALIASNSNHPKKYDYWVCGDGTTPFNNLSMASLASSVGITGITDIMGNSSSLAASQKFVTEKIIEVRSEVDDIANAVDYVPKSLNLLAGVPITRLTPNGSTMKFNPSANAQSYYIPVTGGQKYTVYGKTMGNRFTCVFSVNEPASMVDISSITEGIAQRPTLTVTAGLNDNYLLIYIQNGADVSTTGLAIYEGDYQVQPTTSVDGLRDRQLQSTGTPPDLNTNFVWPRERTTTLASSTDYDAYIVTSANVTATKMKNTAFGSWYGNQMNIVFSANSQCMIRQRISFGSVPQNKKYKYAIELAVSGTVTLANMYIGVDANVTRYGNIEGDNYKGIVIHTFTSSDITAGASSGAYDIWLRIFANSGTTIKVGRISLIETDPSEDYPLPYFPLISTDSKVTEQMIKSLSSYTGKKFYSIGDSITYQQRWQPALAKLLQMDFKSAAVSDGSYPLGIGGATLCPFVRVTTTNQGDSRKILDGNGNQLRDEDDNPLWFHIGQGVNESIYYRAGFFANQYNDAEVIVVYGGQNDEKDVSYSAVGNVTDTPYEGKQYVLTQYAEVAKYYDVAIYDDGTLDRTEYPAGTYDIITERPSLCAVVAGIIKRLCTSCPGARVTSATMMRLNRDVSTEREVRVAQKDAIANAFKQYGIPVADLWNEMGVNTYNYTSYYGGASDVHPSEAGGRRMAAIMSKII